MRRGSRAWLRPVGAALAAVLLLGGCARVLDGRPVLGNAQNANLQVQGDSGSPFDTLVKNSLSDIFDFWKIEFPKISGGKPFAPLQGGLYSVDGAATAATGDIGAARHDACLAHNPPIIVNNGSYCPLDDAIAWDRSPDHLLAQLADKYGPLMLALVFAHEVGHAISYRMGVFNQNLPTIDTESQADCAAGAWAAYALHGDAAHLRGVTSGTLGTALEGFLDARDPTPGSLTEVSHGNGFDRLSAVADGIDRGASYCYSDGYFTSRVFTERPYTRVSDYASGGNAPLSQVLEPGSNNLFVEDLNRFWTDAASSIGKRFIPVAIAEADHPPCLPATEFAYCPQDNTVYYNATFAREAYYSLPGVRVARDGNVVLVSNQPADFALGVLFAIGWGMAVRHQLYDRSLDDRDALTSAICYTGAYAKDINLAEDPTRTRYILLSPADLDEATSAMLDQVGKPIAFGARGTSGLDRIQAFVKGYRVGRSGC